ncbi:hypothetical protein [Acinetobacter nectaris]|uniref:hypothetical protein n=1 Tax=Acinetobacter nectaris TaxID=1219382 RepID=UPI001F3F20ED|nr:hypothetical protein [Acinetobacter nectaris]MCF9045359.1 hypothetical protein [Acinetobacter nectaris]
MKDDHIIGENITETIKWLMYYDDCFDELIYNSFRQEWTVKHAAGEDVLREGMFLTAKYGLLVTS